MAASTTRNVCFFLTVPKVTNNETDWVAFEMDPSAKEKVGLMRCYYKFLNF